MMVVLLLAMVLVQVLANPTCPENCSNHGTCNGAGICSCYQYFSGVDCSIYERIISNGETISNSVPTHQWQFYHLQVPSGSTLLNFSVHELTTGDSDLYIKFGEHPRRDNYDALDLNRAVDYSVVVLNPQAGAWYAGVYGFYGCDYQITSLVSTASTCPGGCSGHGTCNQQTSQCSCQEFWTGDDCAKSVQLLSSGAASSASVAQGVWNFYYVRITTENELRIIVNETTTDGDSDLYVAYNRIPSLFEWDTRDATLSRNYQLTIDGVRSGVYYIGVYGYKATAYNIVAQYAALQVCANRCSDHGTCSGTTCSCRPEYSGSDCESMLTELSLEVWVNGFVRDNSWNFYHITPNSASNLVITVNQGTTGDCDLYVKAGSNPSRFDYDHRDVSFAQQFDITVENPQDQTWYIGVFGYQECSYRVRAQTSGSACPNACSRHGSCVQGRCACTTGWAGEDCAAPLHHLSNGVPRYADVVPTNQWQYYKFEVGTSASYMLAQVVEYNTTGNVWLYVNQGAPPTLTDYDYSNTRMDSSNHVVYFRTNAANQDQTFYIGVYGDPISEIEHPVQYTIVAYTPPI